MNDVKAGAVGNAVGQPDLAAQRGILLRRIGEQEPLASAVGLLIDEEIGEAVLLVMDQPKGTEAQDPVCRELC